MIKIAFIFNGLARCNAVADAAWRRIIDACQADVFAHTWDTNSNATQWMLDHYQPTAHQIDQPIEIDTTPFQSRLYPGLNAYNIFSMWTSIQRGFQLMVDHYAKLGTTPDVIVRSRFDLAVENLHIDPLQPLVIPWQPDHQPNCFHWKRQFLVPQYDVLCYGHMEPMRRYCNTINLLPGLHAQGDFTFTSENMLAASLYEQRVPFINQLTAMHIAR